MSQNLKLSIAGLHTNQNQFSEIPPGALSKANNAVIDKGGVIESRRGFKKYGNSLGSGHSIDSIHIYKEKLIAHHNDDTLSYDSDGSGTWVDYSGTITAITGYKIRSVNQNGNFYFTTSSGVKKLDSLTASVVSAGIAKALDNTITTTGGSGYLSNNSAVAYRTVWGLKDANNNLLLGAPSGRTVFINTTGGTRNASITIPIPSGVTTAYFYQVYRSNQVAHTAEPNDELQLVYEGNPSGAEISAGSLTITDVTIDSLRGAFLYTSNSQEGILQSNDQPPLAKDICSYKNILMYANTSTKQNFTLTYINGLQVDDTVVIDGITYTAKSSENFASAQFKVFSTGTPSTDIQDTATSLVKCINSYASNTSVYAYYISGYTELPGAIYVEDRIVGGTSWTVQCSLRGTSFNPVITTAQSSTNDTISNRIYYSKQYQPEAVPALNYFEAGSSEYPIRRIIPLRDSVFVLKDDGIYRILGEDTSSLRISIFDTTATVIGAETAVELNNTIFAYSDQGIVSISDNGLQVMGRPIEDQLLPLEMYTDFSTVSFGCAYESDRKYLFFCQITSSDTNAKQVYVYNLFTNAWTRWTIQAQSALVYDYKLYYGYNGYLYQERKNYSISDYNDDEHAITISSISNNTITFSGYSESTVGMMVKQGDIETLIESIVDSSNVVVEDATGLTASSATIYELIDVQIEWAKQDCGNPGILKHFREVTCFFRDRSIQEFEIGFSTNFISNPEYTTITPEYEGAWGEFIWGEIPWGGSDISKPNPFRTYIPSDMSRAHWIYPQFRSRKAQSNFALSGVSLMYNKMSERYND